jgi:MazG family protein
MLLRMKQESEGSAPRPLETPPPTGDARLDALARLLAIVDRLRAPDGCPWDREQTVASMAPSLVEEAFEAVETIDRADDRATAEELGDLLMVIALVARIAGESGRFDLGAVAAAVSDKLVRRHPHVFGTLEVDGAEHVLRNWEAIKQDERRTQAEDASALAGVPAALPALQRADRVGAKAISAGFRWTDASGAFAKLREEVGELEAELARQPRERRDPGRLEAELGDVLLAGAFLGRYLGIDPERAARGAVRRFEQRFRRMERELGARFRQVGLPELERAWERAKAEDGP